jgi:hypothetical protein
MQTVDVRETKRTYAVALLAKAIVVALPGGSNGVMASLRCMLTSGNAITRVSDGANINSATEWIQSGSSVGK